MSRSLHRRKQTSSTGPSNSGCHDQKEALTPVSKHEPYNIEIGAVAEPSIGMATIIESPETGAPGDEVKEPVGDIKEGRPTDQDGEKDETTKL